MTLPGCWNPSREFAFYRIGSPLCSMLVYIISQLSTVSANESVSPKPQGLMLNAERLVYSQGA